MQASYVETVLEDSPETVSMVGSTYHIQVSDAELAHVSIPSLTVILGHNRLLGNGTQLDLDVHHPDVLGRNVDLD